MDEILVRQDAAPAVNLTAVESGNIAAIGYDQAIQTLGVRFKARSDGAGGDLWYYAPVPPDIYEAMKLAPSIGSYFSKFIRPRFNGRKIGPGQPE